MTNELKTVQKSTLALLAKHLKQARLTNDPAAARPSSPLTPSARRHAATSMNELLQTQPGLLVAAAGIRSPCLWTYVSDGSWR
jgi:hypothetical protein